MRHAETDTLYLFLFLALPFLLFLVSRWKRRVCLTPSGTLD